ncbi:aldehyde dehydrogenase, partial [Candidatus Fermentibacterales bacterium]|nr:aldehyde dehydrogenase [Candidatus Fermentibacterales bacterium]
VMDGSLVDLVCVLDRPASVEAVNEAMRAAAGGYLKGILEYTEEPIVSSDVIGNIHSSIFDAEMTRMMGDRMVKVLSWYDNEFGYAARMMDMLEYMEQRQG